MNYSFLLLLLLIGFVPLAFAETEHGKNYDKEILENSNGKLIIKHRLLSYERINPLGTWQDYLYTNYQSYHEIKTATNTIQLDKSTCGFSFYNKDNVHLFGDSIIAFNSIVDQYTWNAVTSVNNASCQAYYDSANHALVAKKYAANVGYMEYKYIFDNGKWKTQLEATNLSSLTNRVFAFDQTIDLKRDTIFFGKQQRNLDNFNGTTFDRTWLETNEGKVLDFLNNFSFDLDQGFEYLDSVKVTDTGPNKSKITFHYMRNNEVLLPNETLIIDPTFAYTSSVWKRYFSDLTVGGETSCIDLAVGASDFNNQGVLRSTSLASGRCQGYTFQTDISSLPTSITVSSANLRIDVSAVSSPNGCDVFAVTNNPNTASDATIWADMFAGNQYVSDATECDSTGNNKVIALNSLAYTDIRNLRLASSQNFTFSMVEGNWNAMSGTSETTLDLSTGSVDLEIIYAIPTVSVSDLNVDIVGDAAKVTGIITVIERPKTNVTSVEFLVNGTILDTNSTIYNATEVPYDVNFGPFWYQMITDSIYNFTIQAFIQSNVTTSSNSSSTLDSRSYDPDYFTALDPTQGTVNYTFPGGDLINVNRDTSGVVFNIECQYFTQAQAFLNELTSGTWDNETNVLFYQGDTTGFYYLRCFNDGELFITAISQNYTNALVPGLLIFDQLGGFFGAPSIILVIISILSLGTGRNYPIVMLIAAAVTGILLALELLTLDPGLVVAIIVMTGFGLFGIRKFY